MKCLIKQLLFVIIILICQPSFGKNVNNLLFSLNNKIYTTIDLENRINYLRLINSTLTNYEEILDDYIKVIFFDQYYRNNNKNENENELFDIVNKYYKDLIKNNEKINSNQNSIDIYNQKLKEINFDIENHLITKSEANNAIEELEYSLIKDNKNTDILDSKLYFSNLESKKTISIILLLVIPVFVISVYSFIGTPNSIEKLVLVSDLKNTKSDSEKLVSVEQMLKRVERRLLDDPNNSDDWLMLANSYVVLKRYPEAIRAFENLYRLKGDDPSLLFRYADVLAMANSGIFAGKPSELIKKALQLDPQNTMGLWLAGLVAYEEGEVKKAINYWENVLPKLEIGSEEEKNIRKYIEFAKENNNISIQNNKNVGL